jgi:glycosyltransferase involved in cell wall biosynthesis
MAAIVLADDGFTFDGATLRQRPLGGAETAVVSLAEALARRGHEVEVRNRVTGPRCIEGVHWAPLAEGLPAQADLYIANRASRLIDAMPQARRSLFWIHNPAGYLLKWRFLKRLWRVRPAIVFSGRYHAAGYPRWAPAGARVTIPYGIPEAVLKAEPAGPPPPPRAVFTSNPQRGLDWLLDLWIRAIRPRVPGAELHLLAGPATYAGRDAERMAAVLDRARALSEEGVLLRAPLPKGELAAALAAARVMLYRGDPGETFCLAVAEAQAVGLPAVVQPIGCLAERVIDGETGFVAPDDDTFAARAVALLSDDVLWRRQQEACLARQRDWTWARAAGAFEALIP